jgi:hypothetical protein
MGEVKRIWLRETPRMSKRGSQCIGIILGLSGIVKPEGHVVTEFGLITLRLCCSNHVLFRAGVRKVDRKDH